MRTPLRRSSRLHRDAGDRHLSIWGVLRPDDLLGGDAGLGEDREVGGGETVHADYPVGWTWIGLSIKLGKGRPYKRKSSWPRKNRLLQEGLSRLGACSPLPRSMWLLDTIGTSTATCSFAPMSLHVTPDRGASGHRQPHALGLASARATEVNTLGSTTT